MKPYLLGQYAGGITRGIAWAIDMIIIVTTLAVVTWLITASFGLLGIYLQRCPAELDSIGDVICLSARFGLAAFAILILPVYMLFFWTASGQTIGNAILGIRVVRVDGESMTLQRSLRRLFGYIVCFLTLGIGFAFIFVDNQRQGLHDTIARTYVIYAWRGNQDLETIEHVQTWLTRKKKSRAPASKLDS